VFVFVVDMGNGVIWELFVQSLLNDGSNVGFDVDSEDCPSLANVTVDPKRISGSPDMDFVVEQELLVLLLAWGTFLD